MKKKRNRLFSVFLLRIWLGIKSMNWSGISYWCSIVRHDCSFCFYVLEDLRRYLWKQNYETIFVCLIFAQIDRYSESISLDDRVNIEKHEVEEEKSSMDQWRQSRSRIRNRVELLVNHRIDSNDWDVLHQSIYSNRSCRWRSLDDLDREYVPMHRRLVEVMDWVHPKSREREKSWNLSMKNWCLLRKKHRLLQDHGCWPWLHEYLNINLNRSRHAPRRTSIPWTISLDQSKQWVRTSRG